MSDQNHTNCIEHASSYNYVGWVGRGGDWWGGGPHKPHSLFAPPASKPLFMILVAWQGQEDLVVYNYFVTVLG